MRKDIIQVFVFFFLLTQFLGMILPFQTSLFVPKAEAATPYITAFTTMSNSRLSFKGAVATSPVTAGSGGNLVLLGTGNTAPDTVIDNLFVGDQICFMGDAFLGCKNSTTSPGTTYLVSNIPGGTGSQFFAINTGLTGTMAVNDFVISTQSGYLTITFKPQTNIAIGDTIQIIVTSAAVGTSDGVPDNTGFDAAGFPANLLLGTGAYNGQCNYLGVSRCVNGTGFTINAATLSSGAGSTHTISITAGSALYNSTLYYIAIGDTNPANFAQNTLRFINPAPAAGHVRGNADSIPYSITMQTFTNTGSSSVISDKTIMKVAPNDGVFVSASIELSITYTINDSIGSSYVGVGSSGCPLGIGQTNSFSTTATTVPFGSILNLNAFYNATQTHTVVTNAGSGYLVTVQQDGLMSTGLGSSIQNTACDSGPCTSSTASPWNVATNNGFGYTLKTLAGNNSIVATTATAYRQFSTSPFALTNGGAIATAGDRFAVCYRLSIGLIQKTGFYYNKLTYIATPKF